MIITSGIAVVGGARLNVTESMPLGIYAPSHQPVRVGSVVTTCLPPAVEQLGLSRGYLERGVCPGGAIPVVKRVAAIGPGIVEVKIDGTFADGQRVGGPSEAVDHRRRPLNPLHRVVLAAGEAFLLGESRDSWDSRYYGPVALSGCRAMDGIILWGRSAR